MSKSEITINGTVYVPQSEVEYKITPIKGTPIEQYCIVRCRDAGVWAGIVAAKEGREATLCQARRLWTWKTKKGHTLSAAANYGISEGKLPAAVPVVYLTETCEFIPCSGVARESIQEMEAHNE